MADCRLTGTRSLPGQAEPQVTLHFTARVRLAREAPREDAARGVPRAAPERELGPDEIYRVYFHGPAYRVVEKAWRSNGEAVGLLRRLAAPRPPAARESAHRRRRRASSSCASRPRACWRWARAGRMGLPLHV